MPTSQMSPSNGDAAEATTTTATSAAPGWRNRIVGSGTEAPEQLAANPANWRVHPRHQRDALAGSLDTVGWVAQVLVNQRTGYVVDGHARVALAIARREASVPVLYVDLSPDEEHLVLATFDPIAALAGTDDGRLSALLADVAVDDAGLRALLDELALTAAPRLGQTDPDDVPELPETPYVQAGDLRQLGPHRLLCGDATNASDVARLLDGAQPRITVSDAPYGVSYRPGQRAGARRRGLVANDDRADWSAAWALSPSDVLYLWHSGVHAVEVGGHLHDQCREAGLEVDVVSINVAERAQDPTRFINLRAELWWEVGRDLSKDMAWDLAEVDDGVISQLVAPKYSVARGGRIQVEAKDDVRRRIGRSPDDADALLLAFYRPPREVWSAV